MPMKTSQDRILTTHVGSLPRPPELRQLLVRKDQGESYDKAELDRLTRQAVVDIVHRQAEAGVDIVNDGEMSKPGYSTYVADRLSGFSGHEPAKPRLDTREHPNFVAAYERMTGANVARRAVCVGPIAVRDREPLTQDLANLRAGLAGVTVAEGFMTAASPGLVPVFQTNRHYPTHEAYVEAVAAAMQEEYEAIANAGFVLQLDCPDLAMAHHTSFQDLSEADFLKRAAFHVEVLNHALANVPADRARIHICWGNYEGPHDHDIPFTKVAPILVKAKPMALVVEAANPRHAHEWTVWQETKLPDDKILVPGVLDTSTNYVEHTRHEDLVVGQLGLLPHGPFMRMPRVGGLHDQRHRLRLDQDRGDLRKRDVVVVGPLVIAPADVDARAVRRHIRQGVVQHLDVECRALEEIRFTQILERGVVGHRQVRAVKLQYKPCADDRFVFFLHRCGDGFDISLVGRVMPVGLKHRHETGRSGGHEPFGDRDLGERRAQIGEVLGEGLAVPQGHRADTDGASRYIGAGHPLIGGDEVRVLPGVQARLGGLVTGESGKAVRDIGRVAGLRHLAVIDDVDADIGLAANDVDDSLPGQAVEFGLVIRLALVLAHQELAQLGRPRQAPDMGRQNAVLAGLHWHSPLLEPNILRRQP